MLKDRIDRIIEIKARLMEDKEREIEEERGRLDVIIEGISAADADIRKTYEKMTAPGLKGCDFSVIGDYLEYLENVKSMLLGEQELTTQRIAELKDELVELLKEMKMLETLRTKVISEMKKTSNRREQKLLDSIALRIEEKRY